MYQKMYGKLVRGEKTKSLTTDGLVQTYPIGEERKISPILTQVLPWRPSRRKRSYLKVWSKYVNAELKMGIPTPEHSQDITRDFGTWMLSQEKGGYESKVWSREYVNGVISEVLRMYKKVGKRQVSLIFRPSPRDWHLVPTHQPVQEGHPECGWIWKVSPFTLGQMISNQRVLLIEQGRRSIFRESWYFLQHRNETKWNPSTEVEWCLH